MLLFRRACALEDVINIAFWGATGFYFAHAGIGVWPAVAQVTQVVRRGARGAWVFSLDHTQRHCFRCVTCGDPNRRGATRQLAGVLVVS